MPQPLAEVVGPEPFGEIQPCLPRGPHQRQRKVPADRQCPKQGRPWGQGARPAWTPLPASQRPARPREPGVGHGVCGQSGRLTLAEGLLLLRSAGLVLRTWLCWGCASFQGRVSGGSSRGRPASSAWHTRDWSVRSPCPQASPARGFPAPAARKSNTTAAGKVTELAEQESTRPARPAPCTVCKQNLYNDAAQSCRPCGLQSVSQRIR